MTASNHPHPGHGLTDSIIYGLTSHPERHPSHHIHAMAPSNATPTRGLLARLLAAALFILPLASAYAVLPDDVLRGIPSGDPDFDVEKGSLLAPILIPRIPGTEGSLTAQNHFISFFEKNLPEWTINVHNSTSKTPATGDEDVPFANLIFRRDPPWAAEGDVSRLTLVAHFDTLREPEGFVGAIDSAAPCAMLLHVARSIEEGLAKKWAAMMANGEGGAGLEEEKGVQIVLLDGEEAFVKWTASDSLYGSRCVVPFPPLSSPMSVLSLTCTQGPRTGLGDRVLPRRLNLQDAPPIHLPLRAPRPPRRQEPPRHRPLVLPHNSLGLPGHGARREAHALHGPPPDQAPRRHPALPP